MAHVAEECKSPINIDDLDIEAPLSPVLSNSKQSMKYIARRKSRMKLMNKFSQISALSQENHTQLAPTQSDLTEVSEPEDLDLTVQMKKIKEIQNSKKFYYNIPNATPNEFKFKIPSPVRSKKSLKHSEFTQNRNIPPDIGFKTGSGAKIQLSDRAVQNAYKLFDGILDIPLESVNDSPSQINPNLNHQSEISINFDESLKIKLESPETKFTQQISDTQMFLVAENAENIIEIMDTQWMPNSPPVKQNKLNNNKDFEEFSSQETSFYFGDLTMSSDGHLEARDHLKRNDSHNELLDFTGFELDERLYAKNRSEHYKILIKSLSQCSIINYIGFTPNEVLNCRKYAEIYRRIINAHVDDKIIHSTREKTLKIIPKEPINLSKTNKVETKERCPNNSRIKFELSTCAGNSINISKNSVKKANTTNSFGQSEEMQFKVGFTTAAGNLVNISEESLKKTRRFFDDCLDQEESKLCPASKVKFGFSSASENSVQISEDSLHKVQCLFQEEEIHVQLGFSTAAGKSVNISKDSLKKVQNLFENCKEETPLKLGFSTAAGKSVNISEGSLKKVQNLFENCQVEREEVPLKLGFSTAAGKSVNISEDSLKKVQNLFENCQEQREEVPLKFGFSTAAGKSVNISEESLKKVQNLFENCQEQQKEMPLKLGVSTAAGNSVNISEGSLKKVQNLFENCQERREEVPLKLGFSTAAGKSVNISEESFKKVQNLFENCQEQQEKTPLKLGFSTAAGKSVNISDNSLKKVQNLFENCEEQPEKMPLKLGFSTAAGKSVNISEDSLKKVQNLFENSQEQQENTPLKLGFSTAAGKSVKVTEDSLKKVQNLFENCQEQQEEIPLKLGFSTAAGKSVNISEDSLKKVQNLFENCQEQQEEIPLKLGFSTAAGKSVNISEDSLKKAKNLFENSTDQLENIPLQLEHSTVRGKSGNISGDSIKQTKIIPKESNTSNLFSTAAGNSVDISEESLKIAKQILEEEEFIKNCAINTDLNNTIEISAESLTIAKQIFEEEFIDNTNTENSSRTPQQNNNIQIPKRPKNLFDDIFEEYAGHLPDITTTDIKLDTSLKLSNKTSRNFHSTPKSSPQLSTLTTPNTSKKRSLGVSVCRPIDIPESSIKKAKVVFDEVITPKKKIICNNISTPIVQKPIVNNKLPPKAIVKKLTPIKNDCFEAFSIQEPLEFNLDKMKLNLQKEIDKIKLTMSVLETRMNMLRKQEELIKNASSEHRRPSPGCLYQRKSQLNPRINLKQLVNGRRPGKNTIEKSINMGVSYTIVNINPDTAINLNFYVPWYPNDHRTYPAIIRTEDDAIIIPNQHNQIGVTEIEVAFRSMPGVDPSLIPNGWLRNHFRWIVWKLASLERNYPDIFTNWVSIENLIAQLKYRYDREIDKAQRPAIRKIFECDDTAAKRMILCVATIIKAEEDGKFELELTDGWYSIKTQLDHALNALVERNIINVGMKLMIQGAELSNCEGCYPLEAPAHTRLRIHFNCTRRAAWYSKLGYQPSPGPLCIALRSINGNGGTVGMTCAYIARVYPISFMERSDDVIIWRNRRAEQRRANEWESKQASVLERIQMQVQEQLEQEWSRDEIERTKNKLNTKNIKECTCPKTLFEYIEYSNDPEMARELLTASQCEALEQYRNQLLSARQTQLANCFQNKLKTEHIQPRNVSSVLKLLIIDLNSIYHNRGLSIWKPTDQHLQELKEGSVVRIYNITARTNGTLSSTPRTRFDLDLDYDTQKFEFMDRKVVPISSIVSNDTKAPLFGEFDTVGMIVCIDIQDTRQFLWLMDEHSRFLVIKIRESPQTCSLFDSLIEGKVTTVTNLVYQKPVDNYGEAIANHYTTFSSYPSQSYLQNYMQEFIGNLPEDLETYLEESQEQIRRYLSSKHLNIGNLQFGLLKSQELQNQLCGINQTSTEMEAMTVSDEEMSLLDTQDMV